MNYADLLEALMILCFGVSWPISIRKSWVSRTAKGSGHDFMFYLSWFFYVMNFVEISIDVALYFRNKKLDAAGEAAVAK